MIYTTNSHGSLAARNNNNNNNSTRRGRKRVFKLWLVARRRAPSITRDNDVCCSPDRTAAARRGSRRASVCTIAMMSWWRRRRAVFDSSNRRNDRFGKMIHERSIPSRAGRTGRVRFAVGDMSIARRPPAPYAGARDLWSHDYRSVCACVVGVTRRGRRSSLITYR